MYKYISTTQHNGLSEVNQASSVRYKVLLEEGDKLTEATPWMKCTDYFNDVVVASQIGLHFEVYGLDNSRLNVKGDLFMSVKDFGGVKLFKENIEFINKWLNKEGHEPHLQVLDSSEVEDINNFLVIRVPRYYITNTVYMSLIMLLIRTCTYKEEVTEKNLFELDGKSRSMFSVPTNVAVFDKLVSPRNKDFLDENVFIVSESHYIDGGTKYVMKNKDALKNGKGFIGGYCTVHNAGIFTTMHAIKSLKMELA